MKRRTLLGGALLLAMAGYGAAQEKKDADEVRVDAAPLDNELEKYPRCVICNMDRRRFHYARHLLVYGDGFVQGTCSVHCVAECMLRERRRGFTAIYAPDNGVTANPRPLVEAASATYLIGSDLRGVMTPVSKVPFASRDAALQAKLTYGGEIGSFATAISASLEETANSLLKRYGNDLERQRRKKSESPT
jgi:nitrous oxide reductase accessory protein NosL